MEKLVYTNQQKGIDVAMMHEKGLVCEVHLRYHDPIPIADFIKCSTITKQEVPCGSVPGIPNMSGERVIRYKRKENTNGTDMGTNKV